MLTFNIKSLSIAGAYTPEKNIIELSELSIDNPWDRDVRLKKALGVPEGIFTNADSLIKPGYVKEEK